MVLLTKITSRSGGVGKSKYKTKQNNLDSLNIIGARSLFVKRALNKRVNTCCNIYFKLNK